VCLNDWCADPASGRPCDDRATAFVAAYESVRPLSAAEVRLLPAQLRAAALRFWISRLWDWHLPRDAALLQPKDPTHFERVLNFRIAEPWHPRTS
jgi:homoserine kinase type II